MGHGGVNELKIVKWLNWNDRILEYWNIPLTLRQKQDRHFNGGVGLRNWRIGEWQNC
jgi:hypothetical protein